MKLYTRQEIDAKAVRLAGSLKNTETELIETLQLVYRLKIYEDFKLSSLFAYCRKRLGLSEDRACTYIEIAKVATKIPEVKTAIQKEELSITSARNLARYLTPENQSRWLEKAKTSSTRELQIAIAEEHPKSKIQEGTRPVAKDLFELRCALSPEAEALLKRALDLLSSQKKRDVKAGEAIETILEAFIEKNDPLKKAERAAKKNKLEVPAAQRVMRNGKRTAIPRPVGHIVRLNTGGQCTETDLFGNRCTNRRWVERHHKVEVSQGGLHLPSNLTMLCAAHHRLLHRAGHLGTEQRRPNAP
jgi:hypothetical protein